MSGTLLVLNAGSSSIKFTVFDHSNETLAVQASGLIEGIGVAPHFKAKNQHNEVLIDTTWEAKPGTDGHALALEKLIGWLDPLLPDEGLLGVGHRVVHGGPDFSAPVLVTPNILEQIDSLTPLAPIHQPGSVAGIRAASAFLPGVPQVACFDTSFHRTHPEVADRFGLPNEFYAEGVRRYGFHGLSYEYIAHAMKGIAPEIADGRLIVAHLGNGSSMCAIHNGKSMASTMSFTTLDGLLMGTRVGQLDPGVLLYMMQQKGMNAQQIEDLLYRKSGLLGMSGISNDMRDVENSDSPDAKMAIDYFVHRIVLEVGALSASIGGIDALIFTAGIGENAPRIRERVCERLAWLGIKLDPAANAQRGPRISTADSPISAWVVPTNEEQMIAQHTLTTIQKAAQ